MTKFDAIMGNVWIDVDDVTGFHSWSFLCIGKQRYELVNDMESQLPKGSLKIDRAPPFAQIVVHDPQVFLLIALIYEDYRNAPYSTFTIKKVEPEWKKQFPEIIKG